MLAEGTVWAWTGGRLAVSITWRNAWLQSILIPSSQLWPWTTSLSQPRLQLVLVEGLPWPHVDTLLELDYLR